MDANLDQLGITPEGRRRTQVVARASRERKNCRLYMKQTGFEDGLRSEHMSKRKLTIVEGGRRSTTSSGIRGPSEPAQSPKRFRRMVPYRWMNLTEGNFRDVVASQEFEDKLEQIGLSREDANVIVQGIILELVENVAQHAISGTKPAYALVGMTYDMPRAYQPRVSDLDGPLRELAKQRAAEGAPLIRLLVGDSGLGITPVLTPAATEFTGNPQQQEDRLHASSDAIFWALDRRAISSGIGRLKGLWKVRRIVSSFRGAVIVSSNEARAGHIFHSRTEEHPITLPVPANIAGTVVECHIANPEDPGWEFSEEEIFSPLGERLPDSSGLSCLLINNRNSDLASIDLGSLTSYFSKLPLSTARGLVIAVELNGFVGSPTDDDIRNIIVGITGALDRAGLGAKNAVIVLAGASRRLVSLAIESLNTEVEAGNLESAKIARPTLIVVAGNVHYWVGGDASLRKLLSSLSQVRDAIATNHLFDSTALTEETTLRTAIKTGTDWISVDRDHVSLAVRPNDAVEAVANHINSEIVATVERGDSDVALSGLFLTPSLSITTRWIDVSGLLQEIGCSKLAGLALASRVRALPGLTPDAFDDSIFTTDAKFEEVTRSFGASLTGASRTYNLGDNVSEDLPGLESGGSEAIRLLFTDMILLGGTARRAVRRARSRGFSIRSIACLVDARSLGGDQLDVDGSLVPVVSLVRVNLSPKDDEVLNRKPVPIDPVVGRPLPDRAAYPKMSIMQDEYTAAIIRTNAARLGHIHRPASRHYTAHVDPTILFSDKRWANQALYRISHIVVDNMKSFPDPPREVAIVHPTETEDELPEVIALLKAKLNSSGLNVASITAIPRSVVARDYVFPRAISLPGNVRHVIVLDSSTSSGRSLRQMIRLVSQPRILSISCIVLINGMNDHSAMSLQQIQAVSALTAEHRGRNEQPNIIQTRIAFLARTAVASIDAWRCPVCSLGREYALGNRVLPRQLNEHRSWIARILEPRSKDTIFAEEPTDLFGMPITPQDCIYYLMWRSRLEEASTNTAIRADVKNRIQALSEFPNGVVDGVKQRDALIRLLAAESTWLERAPLSFTSVKHQLATLSMSLLQGISDLDVDPVLRIQALAVLRRTNATQFIKNLERIVVGNADQSQVRIHALLEAALLLFSSPLDDVARSDLINQLNGVLERIDAESPSDMLDGRIRTEVGYLVEASHPRRGTPPETPQQAWALLRSFRRELRQHRHDPPLWRIQLRVENLDRGLYPRNVDAALRDWYICRETLLEKVLPALPILHETLLSDDLIGRLLSDEERQRWRSFVEGDGVRELDSIAIQLGDAFDRDVGLASEERQELDDRLDEIKRFFYFAPSEFGKPRGQAILIQAISDCPSSVMPALKEAFDDLLVSFDFRGVTDDDAMRAYVKDSTFNDILANIRYNAEVTHKVKDADQEFRVIVSEEPDENIGIEVWNSGSAPSPGRRGRGLEFVASQLSNFDGRVAITPTDSLPDHWSFGVKLFVQRWREA
jgi:hypothetical protein